MTDPHTRAREIVEQAVIAQSIGMADIHPASVGEWLVQQIAQALLTERQQERDGARQALNAKADELYGARKVCADQRVQLTTLQAENEQLKKSVQAQEIATGLVHGLLDKSLADNTRLREALEALRDVQNGPPLCKYEKDWQEAMRLTNEALTPTTTEERGGGMTFAVGDIVTFNGILRKIIEVRSTGYTWVYPDIPEKDFISENSNDPFLEYWTKVQP